jgi:hypothetical protein
MPRGVPKNGSKYNGKFSTGQKFGKWEVVDTILHKVGKNASIMMKCECGTQRLVQCNALLSGSTKGCECVIRGNKSANWKGTKDISGRYLNSIEKASQRRNIEWSISREYLQFLWENTNGTCAISGLPIVFGSRSIDNTASLDRKNHNVGYVEGNVQWVHKHINVMKNVFSEIDFLILCKVVYDYNRTQLEADNFSDQIRARKLFRGSWT